MLGPRPRNSSTFFNLGDYLQSAACRSIPLRIVVDVNEELVSLRHDPDAVTTARVAPLLNLLTAHQLTGLTGEPRWRWRFPPLRQRNYILDSSSPQNRGVVTIGSVPVRLGCANTVVGQGGTVIGGRE